MGKALKVEFNEKYQNVIKKAGESILAGGGLMITPAVGDKDYWVFRVQLSSKQAVVAFPKFLTLGIGFLMEEDWNTNLPYQCDVDEIFNHIKHNKGSKKIADEDVTLAIKMIKDTIAVSLSREDIMALNGV